LLNPTPGNNTLAFLAAPTPEPEGGSPVDSNRALAVRPTNSQLHSLLPGAAPSPPKLKSNQKMYILIYSSIFFAAPASANPIRSDVIGQASSSPLAALGRLGFWTFWIFAHGGVMTLGRPFNLGRRPVGGARRVQHMNKSESSPRKPLRPLCLCGEGSRILS